MDVSEAFKQCFKDMHKKAMEKNYQPKTMEQRLTNFQGDKKKTRNTMLLQRRNIDLNMSPIVTPQKTRKTSDRQKRGTHKDTPKNITKSPKQNKRLDLLQKWKQEKEKMKKEMKIKTKPVFKVYHVSHPAGASDLEKVNKEIKGKPIKKATSVKESSWAPLNHKFKAPRNIKPIEMHIASTKPTKSSTLALSKNNSMKPITRSQSSKQKSTPSNLDLQKQKITDKKMKNPVKKKGKIDEPELEIEETAQKVASKNKKENIGISKTTRNKNVGWKEVDMDKSDDVFNNSISKSSSKKKYVKTPIKPRKTIISVSDSEDESFKTPPRKALQRRTCTLNQSDDKTPPKSKSIISISETLKTPPKNPKSQNSTNDKVTIYSDDEISVKTPRRSTVKKNIPQTPKNKVDTSPVYISPFVTISRGKDSARKEFKSRLSSGGTLTSPDTKNRSFSAATSPKRGAAYFARLLDQEIERIEGICANWERYKDENELSEEAQTLIFVPLGQSRLLMSKKFQQFRGLIEKCRQEEYEDEKPITCKDLHGFWDMIYMQVEDLNKRFEYLEKVKANNWEEVVPEKKQVVAKRPKGRPKKPSAQSKLRDFIKAARNKKDVELDVAADKPQTPHPVIVEPIATPSKNRLTPIRPSSARRSLRVSLLCGKAPKRPSTSPCLTMMKISQAIKIGNNLTPGKSILKTDRTKTEGAMHKSVLFRDDLEEDLGAKEGNKENDEGVVGNLIEFSPVTPSRRSTRLSKVKL